MTKKITLKVNVIKKAEADYRCKSLTAILPHLTIKNSDSRTPVKRGTFNTNKIVISSAGSRWRPSDAHRSTTIFQFLHGIFWSQEQITKCHWKRKTWARLWFVTLIRKMTALLKAASQGDCQSRIVELSAHARKKWDGNRVRDAQDKTLEQGVNLGQTPSDNSIPPATRTAFEILCTW